MQLARPAPPGELFAPADVFLPAPDLEAWARSAFLDPASPLYNVVHDHLGSARLGFLWTNVQLVVGGIRKAGRAQMPKLLTGDKWAKARHDYQLVEWFGAVPDFLITLDALVLAPAEDIVFCAIVDHELGHCGQKMKFGFPVFTKKSNKPVFAMRGHDVEEFNFIVERYGVAAAGVSEMFEAGQKPPLFAPAQIAQLCGT